MRLINTITLKFEEFYQSRVPPYAILSHTWTDDEVSFNDMSSSGRSLKKGYFKITQTCRLAAERGLRFAWVDTCCIDKSSSAELTESINSMFLWYKNATVCFVYLEDLPQYAQAEDGLTRCRWFTRGWTIQELLAPETVEFYDMAWERRGSKLAYIQIISRITRIPEDVLSGDTPLAECSVAMKMSWASRRKTTRAEDIAYCLLGIFDVNMPLIYGEGTKAFRRLQEEIVKRSSDLTIFAWETPQPKEQDILGLFADSPAAFVNSSVIQPFVDDFLNFSVTNRGLLVSGDVPLRCHLTEDPDAQGSIRYILQLGYNNQIPNSAGGICLRKIGPGIFYRDGGFPLTGFGQSRIYGKTLIQSAQYYILLDSHARYTIQSHSFRNHAIHVPHNSTFVLRDVIPETLWDATDRVFLKPMPYKWARYDMVIAAKFNWTPEGLDFVVLCDFREDVPTCKIFEWAQYPREAAMIFNGKSRREPMIWADLEVQIPKITSMRGYMNVKARRRLHRISSLFEKGAISTIAPDKLYSLVVNAVNLPT